MTMTKYVLGHVCIVDDTCTIERSYWSNISNFPLRCEDE